MRRKLERTNTPITFRRLSNRWDVSVQRPPVQSRRKHRLRIACGAHHERGEGAVPILLLGPYRQSEQYGILDDFRCARSKSTQNFHLGSKCAFRMKLGCMFQGPLGRKLRVTCKPEGNVHQGDEII